MNIIMINTDREADGYGYDGAVVIPDDASFESLIKIFLRERAGGVKTALQFTGWLFDRFPGVENMANLYYDSDGMRLYSPDGSVKTYMHTLSPASIEDE